MGGGSLKIESVRAMTLLREFRYRFPRFRTDCPMDFIVGDLITLGVCQSISQSGLQGTVSSEVAAGSEGLITLYRGDKRFQVASKVDSVRDDVIRARFHTSSDAERRALREFIKLLGS